MVFYKLFAKKKSSNARTQELIRRRTELAFSVIAFIVVLILTFIQIDRLKAGDSLFIALFNLNFVLLIAILFVVLRNAFKLLIERRKRILGSRLRTRLMLAFIALAILPCSLMFIVTTKYVQISMDFWFKDQVETSMETALDLARSSFENVGNKLATQGKIIEQEMRDQKIYFGSPKATAFIESKRFSLNIAAIGFFNNLNEEVYWNSTPGAFQAWKNSDKKNIWDLAAKNNNTFFIAEDSGIDYVFTAVYVNQGNLGYFVLAESLGPRFSQKLDRVVKGAGEYKNLRNIKQPLKLMLYSSLGVLTALILLAAIWIAFRMAKDISAPLFTLAKATKDIANGDLAVRLSNTSNDEMNSLFDSFNSMAYDLEKSHQELTSANIMLEQQNTKIAERNAYIETILETVSAGLIAFTNEGIIKTANQAACQLLNVDSSHILNHHLNEVFSEPYAENILSRKDSKGFKKKSISMPLFDGEKILLITVVHFAEQGEFKGGVAFFEDISEMERMQRMAAWREVAKRIAHEIKNPLTPIKLSAQRIEKKFKNQIEDPAFVQSTQVIIRQVEHLQEMVQEFSTFAKLPEIKLVDENIIPIIEQAINLFKVSHQNITWKFDYHKNILHLPIDKKALYRVFVNIFSNSVEALENAKTKNPLIEVSIDIDKKLEILEISIKDNGPGLTNEERAKVFEPYFSHKKGGTGLGLTIVKSIITDHKGYIEFLPRHNNGTVVMIKLPIA